MDLQSRGLLFGQSVSGVFEEVSGVFEEVPFHCFHPETFPPAVEGQPQAEASLALLAG